MGAGGVLLIGEYSPDLNRFIERCEHPLVLVDMLHDGESGVVTIDNFGGIGSVIDHLIELGHHDIGYVGGMDNPGYRERRVSFEWKMAYAGLPVRREWICEGAHPERDTREPVTEILKQSHRPTAFVCCNDWGALGVLRAAQGLGINAPQQLSIVGFDDNEGASFMTPALTTVHVSTEELGRRAAQLLLLRTA